MCCRWAWSGSGATFRPPQPQPGAQLLCSPGRLLATATDMTGAAGPAACVCAGAVASPVATPHPADATPHLHVRPQQRCDVRETVVLVACRRHAQRRQGALRLLPQSGKAVQRGARDQAARPSIHVQLCILYRIWAYLDGVATSFTVRASHLSSATTAEATAPLLAGFRAMRAFG